MDKFYRALPVFTEMSGFFKDEYYQKVPGDWLVAVTDVRSSTVAIEQGLYKDVNFLGAANITAFLQLISPELPFCFGGDGATILIRAEMRERAIRVLQSLCYWAKECFQLELHAGVVTVEELRELGTDVLIAKYQAYPNICQALFSGGGLTLAETLIKTDANRQVNAAPIIDKATIFSGLTCRWMPIPASKGVTLSLIVKPQQSDSTALEELIYAFEAILGNTLENANPINMDKASYYSFLYNLKRQLKVSGAQLSRRFFSEILELFITIPAFNFRWFNLFKPLRNYMQKLHEHCDFQKYDDTLKLVLDCTPTELQDIMATLESYASKNQIIFGAHASDAAQITCYVETIADGGHLHFVDGTNGGYAMAAKMLKENSRKLAQRTAPLVPIRKGIA